MKRSDYSTMNKLLVATTNRAKFDEFATYLKPLGVSTVSLEDIGITEQPIEDAETFEENSLIKANFYWQRSEGVPTLTDDGGLEIDALNGQSGVHSRRIDGIDRTDEELKRIILERVHGLPDDRRSARLRIVVTLRVSADRNFQTESSVEGMIRDSTLSASPGFPYRAILWIPRYTKFYGECSAEEYAAINHRKKAIEHLTPYIKQYVL